MALIFSRIERMWWIPLVAVFSAGETQAAGRPSPTPPAPTQPVISTPNPARPVVLPPVHTMAFPLPNGQSVQLTDLDVIFSTSVTQSSVFMPTDPNFRDPCDRRIEVRAAVSSIDLNAFELGVNFGYTPQGATSIVHGINGKANVKVGTIAMDFGVYDCTGDQCSKLGGSFASHSTVGTNIQFEIDFGQIKTGPALIYNTPLGGIFRAIMTNGMQQLARHPRVPFLPWKAMVREVIPEVGLVFFDAGRASNIAPNQAFSVLAVNPGTGICQAYRSIADVSTQTVDMTSSGALIQSRATLGSARPVQVGDIVQVRVVGQ